ncbi:MAG: glycosyl hydrolase [Ilumatobacteraceae bacterium]|nr:glycosyl hydrolase [Ilumatobacteraceae bacterium]
MPTGSSSVVSDHHTVLLDAWEVLRSAPGSVTSPDELDPSADWVHAPCPGTVASAWRDAGRWSDSAAVEIDFDGFDWWFRTTIDTDPTRPSLLRFGGIATIARVWVDGTLALESESMFAVHDLVLQQAPRHEVVVVCRSLEAWLGKRRPRGRWKTRLIAQQQLRWVRTSLLGRMPSWPPRAAPVGLWRPVELVTFGTVAHRDLRVTTRLDGDDGVVAISGSLDLATQPTAARLVIGGATTEVALTWSSGSARVHSEAAVPEPERWWPGTHGRPALHAATLEVDLPDGSTCSIPLGDVGFRSVVADRSDEGFGLRVNDEPIFCRGVCWVPIDPVAVGTGREHLREALQQIADAGMNMVRITGTMAYEQPEFYELCDELGIMVWHDLMFANMDYPIDDDGFAAQVMAEIEQFVARAAAHPCVVVVCGGSEVEQQAAMMGIDPAELDHRLGREVVAAIVRDSALDVAYVVDSPSAGVFPFSVSTGVSHYYGVGAYRRPMDDARRAGVRFTSECLAFSNVPCREALEPFLDAGDQPGHSPVWKRGVPRDRSAGWDFEDVRDHYVREVFGVDPFEVRAVDPDRYLDLGRAAVAVVMEATMGEWRRDASPCNGGLVFTARDLTAGAGWGVVDSAGRPKSAHHALARACAPLAVWTTDEGLNGLVAHLANDGPAPFVGSLAVRLFDADGAQTATASTPIALAPHGATSISVDALFGGFRDLTHAYRFGPLAVDAVALQLLDDAGAARSDATFLPGGHARPRLGDIGLEGDATPADDGTIQVRVRSRGLAHFVSLDMAGHAADANWFHLAPGDERTVRLRPLLSRTSTRLGPVVVRALNSRQVISVALPR